jgi:hypothetical protein
MNSGMQTLRELESRRKALNERLMNSQNIQEANNIERELWAIRAAIHELESAVDDKVDISGVQRIAYGP